MFDYIDKSRLTDEIRYLPPIPDEAYEDGYEGPTCHICDGLGHGYLIGWRLDVDGNDAQPVYSGACRAFEDFDYGRDDDRGGMVNISPAAEVAYARLILDRVAAGIAVTYVQAVEALEILGRAS